MGVPGRSGTRAPAGIVRRCAAQTPAGRRAPRCRRPSGPGTEQAGGPTLPLTQEALRLCGQHPAVVDLAAAQAVDHRLLQRLGARRARHAAATVGCPGAATPLAPGRLHRGAYVGPHIQVGLQGGGRGGRGARRARAACEWGGPLPLGLGRWFGSSGRQSASLCSTMQGHTLVGTCFQQRKQWRRAQLWRDRAAMQAEAVPAPAGPTPWASARGAAAPSSLAGPDCCRCQPACRCRSRWGRCRLRWQRFCSRQARWRAPAAAGHPAGAPACLAELPRRLSRCRRGRRTAGPACVRQGCPPCMPPPAGPPAAG